VAVVLTKKLKYVEETEKHIVMGASKIGYVRQIIVNAFIDQGNNVIISGRNNSSFGLQSFCSLFGYAR
jgi:short-subunit dehydrogenase involved in D-alanine esterification of teichoic acids